MGDNQNHIFPQLRMPRWLAGCALFLALAVAPITGMQAQAPDLQQTESRLRETIEDLRNGQVNLEQMEPMLRVAVEQQQPTTRQWLNAVGRVTSIDYVGPQNGSQIYRVRFERAVAMWGIAIAPNGNTMYLFFQQVQ
jgi:hypothetical protein